MSEWYFGHNCENYLPTLGKCRVLSQNYRKRPDLLSDKWLDTADFLVYMGAPVERLLDEIEKGEVKVKRQKTDGKVRFHVKAPWAWDDCHATDTGGQCLYYAPHSEAKIQCIKDLRHWGHNHPNLKAMPTEDEILRFEHNVFERVEVGSE